MNSIFYSHDTILLFTYDSYLVGVETFQQFSCFMVQVLDREGQMDNPCSSWLAEYSWDNITELDK